MSLVPGNIVVTFVANYVGTHRVCYRQGNSGDYTCITTDCASVGACEADIPIFVDNETCTNVLYTGYVQASCVPEDSTSGRITWSVSFVPSPACKTYSITCIALPIATVNITNPGSGYALSDNVLVQFGGSGGDAHANAVIGTGIAISAAITNPGSGYNNGIYTNVTVQGRRGGGGTATVTISGGMITSIIVSGGNNYYPRDAGLTLDATQLGGSTPTLELAYTLFSDYGSIIGITNLTNLVPFHDVPIVSFIGGSGSGTTGTAVLADCPAVTTSGCTGSPVVIASGVATLMTPFNMCAFSPPSVGASYSFSEVSNCLCGCVTATISVTGTVGTQVRYMYNRCNSAVITGILTVGGSPSSIVDCIVSGTLLFQKLSGNATGAVTYGSNCS